MPGWTLVGGVSQLYQGDLDLGRLAVEALVGDGLGPHVLIEELHYGAVAVAQRLQELEPIGLVLVGAEARGREPGTVRRWRVPSGPVDPTKAQQAVAEAGTGYVGIDLVVDVARAFEALPDLTVVIEVEPLTVDPGSPLSEPAQRGLDEAIALVRDEAARMPALELAGRLRRLVADTARLEPSPALDALLEMLRELAVLGAEGRWGHTFRWRDRLRQAIAAGDTGTGMDHLDWGLWWALIEALDRLEAAESE